MGARISLTIPPPKLFLSGVNFQQNGVKIIRGIGGKFQRMIIIRIVMSLIDNLSKNLQAYNPLIERRKHQRFLLNITLFNIIDIDAI
jgi:hypothetical protein